MNRRPSLPPDFLLQAEDLIARLDDDLALFSRAAQNQLRLARSEQRQIVERLFRSTHTLKGTAATFDEPLTARLAHEIENTLHALRRASPESLAASLREALQATVDTISVHLRGRAETDGTEEEERHRAELEAAADAVVAELQTRTRELRAMCELQNENAGQATDETVAGFSALSREELPAEWQDALPDAATVAHLRDAARDELNLFSLVFNFNLETFEDDYRRCEAVLREHGEIIASRPLPLIFDTTLESNAIPRIKFCFLYAALLEAAALSRVLTNYEATTTPLHLFARENERDAPSLLKDGSRAGDAVDDSASAALVRVSLDELDELVYLVAELQDKTRARFSDDRSEATETSLAVEAASMGDDLRRQFLSIQERLLRLRMAQVEPRLEEAARAGRVAARARGKQVEWKIACGDVRLDKVLAEQLTAPLLHLVRNAVDHGIETVDERRTAGKAERGTISLRAEARGGQVRVLISDDGRGIEPERVRAAAVRRGIISPARLLKEEDHLRLIFRPGFTTAESAGVVAVSGRGVGLDAAERAVRELGGELRVNSTPGQGTTFEMRLPLTLALLQAIIVRNGNYRYCIPAEQMLESIRFDKTQIKFIENSMHLAWGVEDVPLFHLSSLLNADAQTDASSAAAVSNEGMSSALILRLDKRRVEDRLKEIDDKDDSVNYVALMIDEWEPPDEILARGLGAHAPQWLGILSAAARPDGTIALLLDIAELIETRRS